MTDANAQPKMASNAEAMTAASQLPPATDSQPMAASGAFRQEAWMVRDPCVLGDWADLIPGRHRDHALFTGYVHHALAEIDGLVANALDLALNELQIQFPVMRQYKAKTYFDTNRRIVFTPSNRFTTTTPRRIGI